MEAFLIYLLKASGALTIMFTAYWLLMRNDTHFALGRWFILASIAVSFLLPLANFNIPNTDFDPTNELYESNIEQNTNTPLDVVTELKPINSSSSAISHQFEIGQILNIAAIVYLIVCVVFVSRLIISILNTYRLVKNGHKYKYNNYTIVETNLPTSPYSVFKYIFVNKALLNDKEHIQIIEHEKIHVLQHHTIDKLIVNTALALMWFNPVVWLLRNSLFQLHEYLADEGVLKAGYNTPCYQALLVNQLAGCKLVGLANSFNYPQIKKRLVMMTKPKTSPVAQLKALAVVPVIIIMAVSFSCLRKNDKPNVAVSPDRMNVFYLGADNEVSIAVSDAASDEIEVTTDNGTITGSNGKYIVHPAKQGKALVKIYHKGQVQAGKEINTKEFRVKVVPDPVAKISGKRGGQISMNQLIKAGGIDVEIENFDFDLTFEVVSFNIATTSGGFVYEAFSNSSRFTPEQIELIKKAKPDQKLYFEAIKVKGPDGIERLVSTMSFTIAE
jgi:beta-lactamase regulating signal transducer with metallopeptidase domain